MPPSAQDTEKDGKLWLLHWSFFPSKIWLHNEHKSDQFFQVHNVLCHCYLACVYDLYLLSHVWSFVFSCNGCSLERCDFDFINVTNNITYYNYIDEQILSLKNKALWNWPFIYIDLEFITKIIQKKVIYCWKKKFKKNY